MKRILARDFYGPDGRMYKRATNDGQILVHTFPDDMKLPRTAMTVEEASAAGMAGPDIPDEPQTLAELTKRGRAQTSVEAAVAASAAKK